MPSLEMLKKLLDEFTEKEAHAREEINVINEQIVELEKRIAASQAKLSTVAVDREKVRTMQARYSGDSTLTSGPLMGMGGGASASSLSLSSQSSAALDAGKKEETPRARPGRAAAGGAESGIPVAPLNLRASQTRIPAMKLPESLPETPEPAEAAPSVASAAAALSSLFADDVPQAVSPASPFSEEPPKPASTVGAGEITSKFSPLDIFGAPTDEIPSGSSTSDESEAAAPAETSASNSFFGESQPAAPTPAPADVQFNTGSATIDIGLPSNQQSDVGLETSDSPFYKPIGAEALQTAGAAPTAQDQPASADDDDSAQISDLEDEPDDTVKSINDALRGLFR